MSNPAPRVSGSIDLIIPPALGDAFISTAVARYLLTRPGCVRRVRAWTTRPWVFSALAPRDGFVCRTDVGNAPSTAVKLEAYLDLLPHRRVPPRHHVLSMLEVADRQLGGALGVPDSAPGPAFAASARGLGEATACFEDLREWADGGAVVWLCGRSTTLNRNPPEEFWCRVAELIRPRGAVVELLAPQEGPMSRQELVRGVHLSPDGMGSFMPACAAGIAVDTFGLHLAGAIGFSKVAVVLGSSHPDCVSYPGNRAVYKVSRRTRACQPCGNHGYADEERILATMPGVTGPFRENRCLFPEVECLTNLRPENVVEALDGWL